MSEMDSGAAHAVTRERLDITFHGKEGTDAHRGEINARALATSLSAAADLVQAIASLDEFEDHAAPELIVAATEEGSFEIQLILEAFGEWWASVRPLLVGQDTQAVVNLATLAGVTAGAIKFLKKRGRRLVESKTSRDDGTLDVELDDGEVLSETPEVVRAAEDPRVQKAAKRLVSPTLMPGIDRMEIKAETVNVTVVVNQREAKGFAEPDDVPPEVQPRDYETTATFDRPDFGGDRWGVNTLRGSKKMTIADQDFLRRVNAGSVSLNKYSEFRIAVHEEPRVTPSGQTRFDRTVTKVRGPIDEAEAKRALPDETGEGEIG